jgi:hypothetical protein
MKWIVYIAFIVGNSLIYAQSYTNFEQFESEIYQLSNQLSNNYTEEQKIEASKTIYAQLKQFYTINTSKTALDYPFSSVKSIGFIASPDGLVKIINWNVPKQDNTNIYYGLIVHFDDKKKKNIVYELTDNETFFEPINVNEYYYNDQWYGALYYKIIPKEKSKKMTYTILGYDANNKTSHIKLIDAITFTGTRVKFGAPIFYSNKKTQKRVLFEHSKKSYMALKYEFDRDRIVFDHLSPETPMMVDFREFYIPDMSYDSFNWTDDKWVFNEDIVAANKGEEKKAAIKVYDMNKDGSIVSKDKKNVWIDPTDKNAPAEPNIHTPALPDPIDKEKKKPSEVVQKNTTSKPVKSLKKSSVDSYYLNVLKSNKPKKSPTNKKQKIKKK